jgi:hypothetical protein
MSMTDSGQHDALVSTLGQSLRRATRVQSKHKASKKVAPQPAEKDDGEHPFVGPRDEHGRPHGVGRRVYNDGKLMYMTGNFTNDEDGLQNGVFEGELKHGQVLFTVLLASQHWVL